MQLTMHVNWMLGARMLGDQICMLQVGEMAGVCQRKAVIVAETKTSCEALLVQIVADKRVADEQEKQVKPPFPFCHQQICSSLSSLTKTPSRA